MGVYFDVLVKTQFQQLLSFSKKESILYNIHKY